jgi:dihydroorotate dehydrogenase (NAD+) catalytic subunit
MNCKPDLRVQMFGVWFSGPILAASGTYATKEFSAINGFDPRRLAAQMTKGITLAGRKGNAQPRTVEAEGGMINSIGLEGPSAEVVIRDRIPFMAQFGPVIVNISGNSIEEYVTLVGLLTGVSGVVALEVNVSCPNIHAGGQTPFGATPQAVAEVVAAIRAATSLPLIVKLTPNVKAISPIALAAQEAGADAISLINTVKRQYAGERIGGLSGLPIKALALQMVREVASKVSVPIIGMGGISTLSDVLEFLQAGAAMVAVGTANFRNPLVMMELLDLLENYCLEHGYTSLSQLRGEVQIKY